MSVTNLDPKPWVHRGTKLRTDKPQEWGHLMAGPNDGRAWKHDPRPEFDVQDNPILAAFEGHYHEVRAENAEAWLADMDERDGYGWDAVRGTVASDDGTPATPDQIEHARRVLTRIKEEG